jgi:hypothetical protein
VQQGCVDPSVSPLRLVDLHHETVEGSTGEVDDHHLWAVAGAPELATLTDAPTAGAIALRPPQTRTGKAGARGDGVGSCHHPDPEDPRVGHEQPP